MSSVMSHIEYVVSICATYKTYNIEGETLKIIIIAEMFQRGSRLPWINVGLSLGRQGPHGSTALRGRAQGKQT
jgi:hypothetical protein